MAEAKRLQVIPDQVATAGRSAQKVATTVNQILGELNGASGDESACGPEAQAAFALMQQTWMKQVDFLGQCDAGLATALGHASSAYRANDNSQFVVVWKTT